METIEPVTVVKEIYHILDSLHCLSYNITLSLLEYATPEEIFQILENTTFDILRILEDSQHELATNGRYGLEAGKFRIINEFLHYSEEIGLPTSVYRQLSTEGQISIISLVTRRLRQLADFLDKIICSPHPSSTPASKLLESELNKLEVFNFQLNDLLRPHLMASQCFYDPQILSQLQQCRIELPVAEDFNVRAKLQEHAPYLYEGVPPGSGDDDDGNSGHHCPRCGARTNEDQPSDEDDEDEEPVVRSGRDIGVMQAHDNFLKYPTYLNGNLLHPMLDTGGGCNMIHAQWVRDHDLIPNTDPERSQQLLMADGSASESLNVIDLYVRFDGKKDNWQDVEFIVSESCHFDAMVGLPFIKASGLLFNRTGQLIFPEIKKAIKPKGKRPIPTYPAVPTDLRGSISH